MDRSVVDDTTTGLMKAFHFLSQQQSRPVKPKFRYEAGGSVVHASRGLSPQQRAEVTEIVRELKALDPNDSADQDRIKDLITELGKRPVKFIPVKREIRIERSKAYPYRSKKRGG